MQARVRQAFKRLGDETQSSSASSHPKATGDKGTQWLVIDAGKERDAVSEEMWSHVESLVKGGLTEPIGKLWNDRIL